MFWTWAWAVMPLGMDVVLPGGSQVGVAQQIGGDADLPRGDFTSSVTAVIFEQIGVRSRGAAVVTV